MHLTAEMPRTGCWILSCVGIEAAKVGGRNCAVSLVEASYTDGAADEAIDAAADDAAKTCKTTFLGHRGFHKNRNS